MDPLSQTERSRRDRLKSLDDSLPSAILQHVLSFGCFYHPQSVNRHWKLLSEKNETIFLKRLYQRVSSRTARHANINEIGAAATTVVVHPRRTKLHAVEIAMDFEGPFNDINKALVFAMQNEDSRILIHDGTYEFGGRHFYRPTNRNLQIFGVGDNVILKMKESLDVIMRSIHIENIQFSSVNNSIACVIWKNCKALIQRCKFVVFEPLRPAVSVYQDANVVIQECVFEDCAQAAIWVCPGADKVSVLSCTFKGCARDYESGLGGSSGILVDYADELEPDEDSVVKVALECVGNTFMGSDNPPIGTGLEDIRVYFRTHPEKYLSERNVFKACQGSTKTYDDANMIFMTTTY